MSDLKHYPWLNLAAAIVSYIGACVVFSATLNRSHPGPLYFIVAWWVLSTIWNAFIFVVGVKARRAQR